MKPATWVVVSAPVLSGCFIPFNCGPGTCGQSVFLTWDGGYGDAGASVLLEDGGTGYDAGGYVAVNGAFPYQTCQIICPQDGTYWSNCGMDAGLLNCQQVCVGGRVPPGQLTLSTVDGSAGSWLARMAELEAAAVHAFEHLAHELDAHGLRQHATHALGAAAQEVRHAQAITQLALGAGHCPQRHPIRPTPLRSLEEVARDNAAEGCGRELIGSLINAHQAGAATDLKVRSTMAAIAADERAHADFSFQLSRALMPRLTRAQRRRVREAQELALSHFAADGGVPARARATLGLMDAEQLRTLVRDLLERARV